MQAKVREKTQRGCEALGISKGVQAKVGETDQICGVRGGAGLSAFRRTPAWFLPSSQRRPQVVASTDGCRGGAQHRRRGRRGASPLEEPGAGRRSHASHPPPAAPPRLRGHAARPQRPPHSLRESAREGLCPGGEQETRHGGHAPQYGRLLHRGWTPAAPAKDGWAGNCRPPCRSGCAEPACTQTEGRPSARPSEHRHPAAAVTPAARHSYTRLRNHSRMEGAMGIRGRPRSQPQGDPR
eukprot:gene17779-biopygen5583